MDRPLDHAIIELRRQGLVMKAIAAEMQLPVQAVQDRWYTLVRQHQVPADVLALWSRKEEVVWSEEEDEALLKLWLEGNDDDAIGRMLKLEKKSKDDMRTRRVELVRGSSPLYLRMLGGQGMKGTVRTGMEKALEKKKYAWM